MIRNYKIVALISLFPIVAYATPINSVKSPTPTHTITKPHNSKIKSQKPPVKTVKAKVNKKHSHPLIPVKTKPKPKKIVHKAKPVKPYVIIQPKGANSRINRPHPNFPMKTLICTPEQYGGHPDGKTLNTTAIQKAIDTCYSKGGGLVSLDEGTWLSGPIVLKSNIIFNVKKGAILKASNANKDFTYALPESAVKPGEAFILANNAEQVAIIGDGTIDGSGVSWWNSTITTQNEISQGDLTKFKKLYPDASIKNGIPRPLLIEYNNVKNGVIFDSTLINPPKWNLVLRNSEGISVKGITIRNPVVTSDINIDTTNNIDKNGIDISSSHDINISDVNISTPGDSISIKSGLSQNHSNTDISHSSYGIHITDSDIYYGNGITIGSETANGINNIDIKNIRFNNSKNGVYIKSARDRGNIINNINIKNLTMKGVQIPIRITNSFGVKSIMNMSPNIFIPIKEQILNSYTPKMYEIHIDGVNATDAQYAMVLSGLPESPIKLLSIANANISSMYGIQTNYTQGTISKSNIKTISGFEMAKGPNTDLIVNE